MTKADANRVGLAYVAESTFGEGAPVPGTSVLQNLRFTSEAFTQDNSTVISQELRSDRQVVDLIRTDVQMTGGFAFELSLGTSTEVAFNDFFRSIIGDSAWSTQTVHGDGTTDEACTITAATSTIAFADGDVFSSVSVGDWIVTGNATTAANNGVFKVVTKADSDTITVEPTGILVDEVVAAHATDSYTVTEMAAVVNGTTAAESHYFERSYGDLATFAGFYGACPSQHTLSVEPGSIVTGGFDFLGRLGDSLAATEGDGSNTAAGTTTVCNAVDNAEWIMEGSVAYPSTAYNHTITPNLRPRQVIGTLGAESMGQGTIGVTGGHTAFYADATVMDKHLDMTETNIAVCFKDTDGHYLVFDYPRAKYSSGRRVAGGINQDVFAEMEWTAIRESTEDVTVRIAKYAAS
ncbi:MAG: hypothetical protein GY856_36755 [bacterium]|nr:hypothetical protein [bacterium]